MEETWKSINYPQKQTLHPENQASKGLNTIYWVFKIVFVYLQIAAGVIIFLISLSQGGITAAAGGTCRFVPYTCRLYKFAMATIS